MNESVRPLGMMLSGVPHTAFGFFCTACTWLCICINDFACVGLEWMWLRMLARRACASCIGKISLKACMLCAMATDGILILEFGDKPLARQFGSWP